MDGPRRPLPNVPSPERPSHRTRPVSAIFANPGTRSALLTLRSARKESNSSATATWLILANGKTPSTLAFSPERRRILHKAPRNASKRAAASISSSHSPMTSASFCAPAWPMGAINQSNSRKSKDRFRRASSSRAPCGAAQGRHWPRRRPQWHFEQPRHISRGRWVRVVARRRRALLRRRAHHRNLLQIQHYRWRPSHCRLSIRGQSRLQPRSRDRSRFSRCACTANSERAPGAKFCHCKQRNEHLQRVARRRQYKLIAIARAASGKLITAMSFSIFVIFGRYRSSA